MRETWERDYKTKGKEFTRLAYTGLLGGLEHLKIDTRLINEKIVKGQKAKKRVFFWNGWCQLIWAHSHETTSRRNIITRITGSTDELRFVQTEPINLLCVADCCKVRRAAFSAMFKSKYGSILAKASALRINLNLYGAPIASDSHTHPSHSQTSRLLTSSLSLVVPVPRPTQCIRDA
jgi:hypothetical protein